jgi:lipopolysaccharide biosynthesis protein
MRAVCLFAQFDPSGRIAEHTLRYVSHLAECGFTVHVACSGVERIAPEDAAALQSIGAIGHARPNAGLDFGAWQALLREGCAEGADEVLLANDSVFGPFADLRPTLTVMRARGLDAWGMVASGEGTWHLQSWFVCLSAPALARPAVQRVLEQPFATMAKAEIVLHGELGLGVALRAEGLACGAVFEEKRRHRLRRFARINPMHLHWGWMIARGGVPFLKVDLLRDNPIRIYWARGWPGVVPGGWVAPIRRRLARPVPARLPPLRTLLLYLALTRDRGLAVRCMAGRDPRPGSRRRDRG